MKQILSEKFAAKGLVLTLSLFVILHLLILVQIVPFEMVWGGRLTDVNQMRTFESVSLAINLLMLAVVSIRAGYLHLRISPVIVKGTLWLMFGMFLLNTVGNLLSENQFEKFVFTPLTLVMALFCFTLARSKTKTVQV